MAFLWNYFQTKQIEGNDAKASNASLAARGNSQDIDSIEKRLDTLSLATHAMWEILSEKYGITEEILLAKMEDIDLRDGITDGKYQMANSSKCPDCGHKVIKRRTNCYWCGATLTNNNPFDGK